MSPVSLDTCLLDRPLASLLCFFFGQLSLNAIAVWTCLVSYQVPTCFSFQMLGHVVQLELPLYRALHSFKLAYNPIKTLVGPSCSSSNPISNCFLCLPLQPSPATDPIRCNPQGTCERRPCRRPRRRTPYLKYFYHFVGCVFGGSRHSELKKHFFAESATMYK